VGRGAKTKPCFNAGTDKFAVDTRLAANEIQVGQRGSFIPVE